MKELQFIATLAILGIVIINHLKIRKMGERTNKALEDLTAIKTTLGKVSTESSTMLEKIKALEEAAANNDTPQEVLDAIAEVKSQAQVVDDLVPDAPEPPPVEG